MRYIVCYDISDDGRRARLAECLKDFGTRIQESVFVADLDEELAGRMRERALAITDPQLDAVHIFLLCRSCASRLEVYGIGHVPKDEDYYIV
ncbi:MAG: CRISPR-associated endonuclease Cas2 [Bryobacteraceae bacterium]